MNPKPILLAETTMNMSVLLSAGRQLLGRTISRNIDSKGLDKPVQKFMASLGEILDANIDSDKLMSELGLLADHYHYTLGLVVSDAVYSDLVLYRQLHVINQDIIKRGYKFCVITGSVRSWRDAVTDGSNILTSPDVRDMFNEIYALLCGEGLTKLWSNYTKSRTTDGTLILVERK